MVKQLNINNYTVWKSISSGVTFKKYKFYIVWFYIILFKWIILTVWHEKHKIESRPKAIIKIILTLYTKNMAKQIYILLGYTLEFKN